MICENARHENMTFHPRFHDSERSSLQRTEWMSWTTPMLCTLLFFSYDTFSLYWLYRIAGTNIGVWKRTDKLSGLICVIRQYSFSEITSEKLFLNHLILPVSIHKTDIYFVRFRCINQLQSLRLRIDSQQFADGGFRIQFILVLLDSLCIQRKKDCMPLRSSLISSSDKQSSSKRLPD